VGSDAERGGLDFRPSISCKPVGADPGCMGAVPIVEIPTLGKSDYMNTDGPRNRQWTAVKRTIISAARLRRGLYAVVSIAIVGCGPANSEFDTLHPRDTTDCSHHIDGSFYGIAGEALGGNDVGAGVFRLDNGSLLIEVTYWVVKGDSIRLDSLRFTAVSSSGEPVAVAKAALLLNPLVPGEDPQLGDLPIELRGDGSVRGRDRYPTKNTTLYRVVLTFDRNLPEQFDLQLPDVWLKDKKYPVRIFGFRNFPGTGLGLCQ
jgi:hypothetical protein